jgi:tetratricopeptide (TPR) repeat protein
MLRRSLQIERSHEAKYGFDSSAADSSRVYLAWVLERKGSYPEAAQLLREAAELDKRTKGADSPDYLNCLHNYAGALIDAGDLDAAEDADRQVLSLREKILGPDHPDLYYPLNNLGYILLDKGEWAASLPFLQRGYDMRRRTPHAETSIATILNNLGRAMLEKGDYSEAEKYFTQALALVQKGNARANLREAAILSNIGLLHFDRGDYAGAEKYQQQALEMRRDVGGEEHPDVATSLIEVAEIWVFEGDPKTAEPILRKALDIREKKFNPWHPAIIAAEVRLGEALTLEGDAEQAEPILQKALMSARSEPFALSPWRVAEAESALGACLLAQKNVAEGEELLHKSQPALSKHPRPEFREPANARKAPTHAHVA